MEGDDHTFCQVEVQVAQLGKVLEGFCEGRGLFPEICQNDRRIVSVCSDPDALEGGAYPFEQGISGESIQER